MGYESQRLLFTLATPKLSKAVMEYYVRNRVFFAPFDPTREESFFTLKGQKFCLSQEARMAKEDRAYRFYLSRKEKPGEIIGLAGLNSVVRGAFQSCFLGYKLDERFLRQGYMTEAIRRVAEIGFHDLLLHRIEANIMPRNIPSLRCAEKAGFLSEGLSHQYLQVNGVWEDHLHMVRINPEMR